MISTDYENQLISAIQTIVDNAISQADFDKTIKATIVSCVDEATGKYKVKYQDSIFYAYASNTDSSYSKDTNVYVLIPGNDTSQNKTIIGSVDVLGSNYVSITSEGNKYNTYGKNCVDNESASFGLCSYKEIDSKVLYDYSEGINLISLNEKDVDEYLKRTNFMMCGASFRTNLDLAQKFKGNYGIKFELIFKDNNDQDVSRNYVIDVNEMVGNPYNFTTASKQTGVFEINNETLVRVEQISIFAYDFPNTDEASSLINDIFVSNIEIMGVSELTSEELNAYSLSLITKKGIYFEEGDAETLKKTIEAELRVKGKVVSNSIGAIKYYWFKENNKISSANPLYSQYGGAGWECINDYNIIEKDESGSPILVEWVPASEILYISKGDLTSERMTYKCVAVYEEQMTSKTVTFYNYDSNCRTISISSSNGTQFFFDNGETDLTCLIDGKEEQGEDYTYYWSVIDKNNNFQRIESTTETAATSENTIYEIKANTIIDFNTYKCSAYYQDSYLGTGVITLTNSFSAEDEELGDYGLIINNGSQVFQYNENGVAPTSKSLANPQIILPLELMLFNKEGNTIEISTGIQWKVPKNDTLLIVSDTPDKETDDYKIYNNRTNLNFSISNVYYDRKDNNNIILEVKYDDHIMIATTSLTFVKQGEIGTNGTDIVCRLIPNTTNETTMPIYPICTYNGTTTTLNYSTPSSTNKWLKIQVWESGEKIFEGIQSGYRIDDASTLVGVEWSILKNKYTSSISDDSNFIVDSETGAFSFDNSSYDTPANIVKCEITMNGSTYYALMPITLVRLQDSEYTISTDDLAGFREVIYSTDGSNPAYYSGSPFELQVQQGDIDISVDENINYEWNVKGQVYSAQKWQSNLNLTEKKGWGSSLEKNQKYYVPSSQYNGLCVNNAIYTTITYNGTEIGSIHIPIYLYLNRFGYTALNEWDGNSISIEEDGGLILTPQIGAGQKDSNNAFTGLFMGSIQKPDGSEIETGLFGYNAGERTIDLSADTGAAKFGKSGAGQIIIDPSSGEALLTSGNYDEEAGTGMEINLSEPSIKFGSGNFEVDKDGQIWATQYATKNMKFSSSSVDGLDDRLEELDSTVDDLNATINYLDVVLPTDNITVETDTARIPTHTATKTIECITTYKGTTIKPTVKIEGSHPGITKVSSSYDTERGVTILSFYVDSTQAISDTTNSYNVTFSYNKADCSPVTKIVSILVIEKGKDGTSVDIKGSEENISTLCQNHSSNNTIGDGYILEDNGEGETGHLFIFTNDGGGNGSLAADWRDVGKIQGQDGTDGRGVQSITYQYLTTDSSIKPDASDSRWKDTMEVPTNDNRYLWQKETITFVETDGQHTTQDTVLLLAVYGETGTGIQETEVGYQIWTDGTTIPTGTWLDDPPETSPGDYLWTRIRIIYTTGDPVDSYSISYTAKDGTDGINGTSITIKSTSVTYQAGTSGTTPPTGIWNTSVPIVSSGQYLWTKTVVDYSDGNSTTAYSVSYEGVDGAAGKDGANGKDGTSVTISSKSVDYQASTSGTTTPTGTWSTTVPSVTKGQYLWARTIVTYSTGDSTTSYSVAYQGTNGTNGTDGTSVTVKSTATTYQTSSSATIVPTGTWSTSIVATDTTKKYLWTKVVVTFSDGQEAVSYSVSSTMDSIEVGGRNLLRLSGGPFNTEDLTASGMTLLGKEEYTGYMGNQAWQITGPWSGSGPYLQLANICSRLSIEKGTPMVYSVRVKFDEELLNARGFTSIIPTLYRVCTLADGNPYNLQGNSLKVSDIEIGKWYTFYVPFTIPTDATEILNTTRWEINYYDGQSGNYSIDSELHGSSPKLEIGNIATDWSAAPEDVEENISKAQSTASSAENKAETAQQTADSAVEQASNANSAIESLSTSHTSLASTVTTNQNNSIKTVEIQYCQKPYNWTSVASGSTYEEGTIYYKKETVNSSDVYSKVRPAVEDGKLQETVWKKNGAQTPTSLDTWQSSRPAWKDGYATYQRTLITPYVGDAIASAYFLMDDYQTVDDLRYLDASNVLSEIRGKNYIFYNEDGFFVYDGATKNESKNAIVINKEGICFQHRDSTSDSWPTPTSVWTIDGRFNAQDIIVENLNAESIVDGVLTLGNTQRDGELLIQDDTQTTLIEFSSQRAIWSLVGERYIIIGKDCGFQMIDKNGTQKYGNSLTWSSKITSGTYTNNTNYYTSQNLLSLVPETTKNADGTVTSISGQTIPSTGVYTVSYQETFEIAEQKITGSTNYGGYIQTVNISTTDENDYVHKGLAFVPKR